MPSGEPTSVQTNGRLPAESPLTPPELARLGLARFVALDFETTGLDPRFERIIELGAVRFEGGEPVARFSELAAYEGDLPPVITRITGITDRDLTGRPRVEELLPSFVEFLGQDPLVGQNLGFDLGFLDAELRRIASAQRPPFTPGPQHDTQPIARTFFPSLLSYGLGALARACGVPLEQAHRAVHDAEATGRVLVELLARARRTPFGELQEMSRILGGAVYTFGELIDGISAIGPGEQGPDEPTVLRDNRIGEWEGENTLAPEPITDEGRYIEEMLAEQGPLSQHVPGFHSRPGQLHMAQEVYTSLKSGGTLLAEAGTGTGKSFAYLLPALMHARMTSGRVIVSTQTRHLQNQLFEKDLPALDEALGGGVRAVLLKGRSNYICKRRYDALITDPDRLEPAERQALLPLVRWLRRTKTGDIGEVPGFRTTAVRGLWPRISSDSGFCSGRVCRGAKHCFLHRVRTSAQRAHVVLVNHALLFADLSSGGGVIGEYDRVIFDEAHHIESIAADHLGITWSVSGERLVLVQLHDPSSGKGALEGAKSLLPLLKTEIERGDAGVDPLAEARDRVADALASGEVVGKLLETLEAFAGQESDNGYSRRIRYKNGAELFAPISEEIARHAADLSRLSKTLDKLLGELDEVAGEMLLGGDDVAGELRRQRTAVAELSGAFSRLTGGEDANTVFWAELPRSGGRGGVTLRGAPLDVGAMLAETLYPKLEAKVFTSATLTVDDSFSYLAGRLGLEEKSGQIYPSPFDMRGQMLIGVAEFVGDPRRDPQGYARRIAELARRLPEELDAGTLLLFTSQRMLQQVWDEAHPVLERDGWLTLAQGISGAQAELLDRFRSERKSVLFGLDSFWEGIDVPGQSLELSIIARLPFAVPTDPLVAARSEKLEAEGINPFMQYTLPEAALRLRQGIGRLIRSTQDVGAAIICDSRIVHSRWGRVIVGSLPVAPQVYGSYEELAADLKRFLRS